VVEKGSGRISGKRPAVARLCLLVTTTYGTDSIGLRADYGMEEKGKSVRRGKPGRKPVEGNDLRKFLATLEAETIKGLKHAAIQEGTTASEVLEKAAAEWLVRRKAGAVK